MKYNNLYPILCVLFLIFIACEGPPGPPGPQGLPGEVGAKGEAGNANVRSFLYEVESSNYVQNFSTPQWWEVRLLNSAITSSVVDDGMVVVYLKRNDGWRALPFTFHNSAG